MRGIDLLGFETLSDSGVQPMITPNTLSSPASSVEWSATLKGHGSATLPLYKNKNKGKKTDDNRRNKMCDIKNMSA